MSRRVLGDGSASESESTRMDGRDMSSFILLWRSSEDNMLKFKVKVNEKREKGVIYS